jgi:uncharacterized protein (DUF849 family)
MAIVRELRPEAVSLALRELCPDENAESEAARFFAWLKERSIWPQYILYSPDDVRRFDALRRRGLFGEERPSCLLVLGRYAQHQEGEPEELDAMLGAADCTQFPWSVCCFGRHELAAMLVALRGGGHARIGFENNLLLADGRVARDNAELALQFTDLARASSRRVASADDIRRTVLGETDTK